MNTESVKKLVPFVVEGVELFDAIRDAKEDKKIRWFEWIGIAREGGDVFQAFTELKGVDISSVSVEEVAEISELVFEAIEKDVRFTVEDVFDVLMILKHSASLMLRKR